MKIITRAEARRQGKKRYYNGQPCRHGHYAERQLSNNRCVECNRAACRQRTKKTRARRTASPEETPATILREPYPCATCRYFGLCAVAERACEAFYQYINGRQWRNAKRRPSHWRYLSIYEGDTDETERA